MGKKDSAVKIHKPKTESDFRALHRELSGRGYVALDVLKKGRVRDITLAVGDAAAAGAQDMAACMGGGGWSTGPLSKVAWSFDSRDNAVQAVSDKDGKPLGLGYVMWGPGNNIPSVIPPLAQSSPYTAAPLRYIADLITGLGVRLMYWFEDETFCEYRHAGYNIRMRIGKLEKGEDPGEYGGDMAIDPGTGMPAPIASIAPEKRPEPSIGGIGIDYWRDAYREWERTWYGYDEGDDGDHDPGARAFLENNNLDLLLSQCMNDHVYLDMFFPTAGLERGRAGRPWGSPKVVRVGFLPATTCRLEAKDSYYYSNHVYVSDQWRRLGIGGVTLSPEDMKIDMKPCAMPQNVVQKLRDIVQSNQRTRVGARPTWVVCPTFYPSGNKPYYPQPAWWSIFTSKAFDFSATILYDKYKARENNTSWGRIIYISLDYLNMVFADNGIAGDKDKQQEFIDQLDQDVEDFLQHRENHGKTMRQFMWDGPDGKAHRNVEIVDVAETTSDVARAGKEELELSTSPIFLALQVDPRLVGVPMVAASNGGTALREMHLLKQQQLNIHQRLFLNWLQSVTVSFNRWDEHARWVITQQTLTTLDNSKTGTVDTVAGERA